MKKNKPWLTEPNNFKDIYKDHEYIILRNQSLGFLCGYVLIKEGHPWYKKDYHDIPVNCHGGLTYSAWLNTMYNPYETNENQWWIGFDCGAGEDYVPFYPGSYKGEPEDYRDIEFVKGECKSIIDQMIEYKDITAVKP